MRIALVIEPQRVICPERHSGPKRVKRKTDEKGNVKYKSRLVIRGFKDRNIYELKQIYAPVSRLPLVRSFLALANKQNLYFRQRDVETALVLKSGT